MSPPLTKIQPTSSNQQQLTPTNSGCYAKLRSWIIQKITVTDNNPWYTKIAKTTAQVLTVFTALLLAIPTFTLSLVCLYDFWRAKRNFLDLGKLPALAAPPRKVPPQKGSATTPQNQENPTLIQTLQTKNKQLEGELKKLKDSQPAKLQPQLDSLRTENDKLTQSKKQLEATIQQKQEELARLTNTLNQTVKDRGLEKDAHEKQLQSLTNQLQIRTSELDNLQQNQRAEQNTTAQLKEQIQRLSSQIVELEKARHTPLKPDQIIHELSQKIKATETELSTLKNEKVLLENHIRDIQPRLEKLTQANKTFAENEKKLLQTIEANKQTILQLQGHLEQAGNERNLQNTKINTLTKDIENLKTQLQNTRISTDEQVRQSGDEWKKLLNDLSAQIQEKEKALAQLQKDLTEESSRANLVQNENKNLRNALNQLQAQQAKIVGEAELASSMVKDLENELNALKQQKSEADKRLSQYELEIENRQRELGTQQNNLKNLQLIEQQQLQELNSRSEQILNLQAQVTNLQNQQISNAGEIGKLHQEQVDQLNQQIHTLQNELQQIRTTLQQNEATINQHLAAIHTKDSEITQLKQLQLQQESNRKQLLVEMHELTKQHATLDEQKNQLANELKICREEIATLKSNNQQLTAHLNKQNLQHQQQINLLQNEIQQLKTQRQDAQIRAAEEIQEKVQKFQQTITSLSSEIQLKESELLSLRQQNEELSNYRKNAEPQIAQLQNEKEQLLDANQQLEKTQQIYKEEFQRLREKTMQAELTKSILENSIEKNQQEIAFLTTQLENARTEAQPNISKNASEWQGHINSLNQQITEKEDAIQQLNKTGNAQKSQIFQFGQQISELTTQLNELKAQNENFGTKLQDSLNEKKKFEANELQYLNQIEQLQNAKTADLDKIEKYVNLAAEWENERELLIQAQKQLQNSNTELNNRILQLELEKTKLTTQLNTNVASNEASVKNQLQLLQNEIQTLKSETALNASALHAKEQEIAAKNEQIERAGIVIETLNQTVQQQTDSLEQLQTNLTNVTNELNLLKTSQQNLLEQLQQVTQEKENALSAANAQLHDVKIQLETTTRTSESKEKEIQRLNTQLRRLQNDNANIRNEKKAQLPLIRRTQFGDLNIQINSLTKENLLLKEHLGEKTNELNKLLKLKEDGGLSSEADAEEIKNLKNNIAQLNQTIEKNSVDLTNLKNELEKKSNELNNLKENKTTLELQLSNAKETQKDALERVEKFRSDLEQAKKVRDQVIQQSLEQKKEIDAQRVELDKFASQKKIDAINIHATVSEFDEIENIYKTKILETKKIANEKITRANRETIKQSEKYKTIKGHYDNLYGIFNKCLKEHAVLLRINQLYAEQASMEKDSEDYRNLNIQITLEQMALKLDNSTSVEEINNTYNPLNNSSMASFGTVSMFDIQASMAFPNHAHNIPKPIPATNNNNNNNNIGAPSNSPPPPPPPLPPPPENLPAIDKPVEERIFKVSAPKVKEETLMDQLIRGTKLKPVENAEKPLPNDSLISTLSKVLQMRRAVIEKNDNDFEDEEDWD